MSTEHTLPFVFNTDICLELYVQDWNITGTFCKSYLSFREKGSQFTDPDKYVSTARCLITVRSTNTTISHNIVEGNWLENHTCSWTEQSLIGWLGFQLTIKSNTKWYVHSTSVHSTNEITDTVIYKTKDLHHISDSLSHSQIIVALKGGQLMCTKCSNAQTVQCFSDDTIALFNVRQFKVVIKPFNTTENNNGQTVESNLTLFTTMVRPMYVSLTMYRIIQQCSLVCTSDISYASHFQRWPRCFV